MKTKTLEYRVTVEWTGNTGQGTSSYKGYERKIDVTAGTEKQPVLMSSDPAFLGDRSRWNPEELLVSSLSACHQLWYLHLCSAAGIRVTRYVDHAEGTLELGPDGSGRFVRVILKPEIEIASGGDVEKARALHREAQSKCFIANSVNFPVEHEPQIIAT